MPSFLAVISSMAAIPPTAACTIGTSESACMRSFTLTSNRRPKVPPGWNRAKSSSLNSLFCNKATAKASPNANVAVVLAVGANPIGQASSCTDTSSATSAFLARIELIRPVNAITGMPSRLTYGSN